MSDLFYIKKQKRNLPKVYWNKTKWTLIEKKALELLEKNFVNDPKIEHYPFPRLIEIDGKRLELKLSHCGQSLDTGGNRSDRKGRVDVLNLKFPYKLKNVTKTGECIINNLLLNEIEYSDIHYANICANEKGHLHLIDFGPPMIVKDEVLTYKKKNHNSVRRKKGENEDKLREMFAKISLALEK